MAESAPSDVDRCEAPEGALVNQLLSGFAIQVFLRGAGPPIPRPTWEQGAITQPLIPRATFGPDPYTE